MAKRTAVIFFVAFSYTYFNSHQVQGYERLQWVLVLWNLLE